MFKLMELFKKGIKDGIFKGKSFRHTNDDKIHIIDILKLHYGLNSKEATSEWSRVKKITSIDFDVVGRTPVASFADICILLKAENGKFRDVELAEKLGIKLKWAL